MKHDKRQLAKFSPLTHGNQRAPRRIRGTGSWLIAVVLLALSLPCGLVRGQEGTGDKSIPSSRKLKLPTSEADSLGIVRKVPMPKIDLPEFVITGKANIDLPEADKVDARQDTQALPITSRLTPSMMRPESAVLSSRGAKEEYVAAPNPIFSGNAFASVGTFFSPRAGLWFGQTVGQYTYSFGGNYYRTKGFAPYTDRSGGCLALDGSTTLETYNPYFDQSVLNAGVSYGSDTYNWYGTSHPSTSRNRQNFILTAGLRNWDRSPVPYDGIFEFGNFVVDDSSASTVETLLELGGKSRLTVAKVPVNLSVGIHDRSIAYGNGSAGVSTVEIAAGSRRYTLNEFLVDGSLHLYLAHGMDGQSLIRFYPHLHVAYKLGSRHTVSAAYDPAVQPGSLASEITANRYVSALSKIKNTDDRVDGQLALESDWTTQMSTRFSVRVQSLKDYPLYADSLARGFWLLAYGGRTMITSFSGEVFAKLPANDYFSAQLVVSTSRNSATGGAVPYLPVVEAHVRYAREIASRWIASAELTLIHERKDNVVGAQTLPSFLLVGLRCEYQLIRQASVFLDIRNLLNQQYEYWRGYEEEPFVLSAGVRLRW